MGKKSKESDAVKSLFTAANPFRRQSQPPPTPPPPCQPKLALGLEPQSPNPNPNPNPNSTPNKRKRKKIGNETLTKEPEESPKEKKRKRKRKRDEVEAEYEKRKYGEPTEEAPAAVNVGTKRKARDLDAMAAPKEEEVEEGFDDEGKLLRTVFVGNLPLKFKKKAVTKEFERFGEIESVRIRSVPLVDSKTPRKGAVIKGKVNEAVDRVHAYIVFKDEQSAKSALSHNMAQVGGNHVRVDMACPPRKKLKGEPPLYERKKTVFVGNLPFDVKDEELYQLFCGPSQSENSVEAIRVVRDPQTSLGKGIAYVLFKTRPPNFTNSCTGPCIQLDNPDAPNLIAFVAEVVGFKSVYNQDAANTIVKKNDLKLRERLLRLSHAKSEATPSKRRDSGPTREFPRKRSAATFNETSSSSARTDKAKAEAASLSYQGLRSSKSGAVKKSRLPARSTTAQEDRGSKSATGPEKKARKTKRPAVAARKTKLLKKRKLESGTPENTHRNKKIRRK